jgi:hypothetical protein
LSSTIATLFLAYPDAAPFNCPGVKTEMSDWVRSEPSPQFPSLAPLIHPPQTIKNKPLALIFKINTRHLSKKSISYIRKVL